MNLRINHKISTFWLFVVTVSLLLGVRLIAQPPQTKELTQSEAQMLQILGSIDNYKYSNVFIFELGSNYALSLNEVYGSKEPTWDNEIDKKQAELKRNEKNRARAKELYDEWLEEDDEDKKTVIRANVPPSMQKYFEMLIKRDNYRLSKLNKAYLVTNRFTSIKDVNIIALLMLNSESEDENSAVKTDLMSPSIIKLATHLKNDEFIKSTVNNDNTFKNVYDFLHSKVIQEEAKNVTLTAQGIDSETLEFLPKKYGATFPIQEDNIQQYLRITEGQPIDYFGEHEITVGIFDLIRYRYYGSPKSEKSDASQNYDSIAGESQNKNTDSTIQNQSDSASGNQNANIKVKEAYNNYLPLFGAEIRYGLPEINYPSLWSERVTLNVMWQSNKLGIILPTNGWSSLANSIFNVERKLTNAGIGLYGSLDFPIKLLNQGGVFNMNASYVFGNSNTNPVNTSFVFQGRTADNLNDSSSFRSLNISYLPRFHAQFHYSFALNIDNSSYFRFKLGATAFTVERWLELDGLGGIDPQTNREIIEKKNRLSDQYSYDDLSKYNRFDQLTIAAISGLKPTEFIAGLSGRIEYYTKSETVPWGFAIQYFDGSFSGDVWLQVPILENLLLRSQAQFFQTAFRDPKPWEVGTIVIPTIQFVYNFSTKENSTKKLSTKATN